MTQHMLKCNRAARQYLLDRCLLQKLRLVCDKLDSVIVVTLDISHQALSYRD